MSIINFTVYIVFSSFIHWHSKQCVVDIACLMSSLSKHITHAVKFVSIKGECNVRS